MRRVKVNGAWNLLRLKMRPDTPQHYEYVTVEEVEGKTHDFINVNPWTQFYDLKDRKDIPLSYANNITMRNCNCECRTYFDVKSDRSQYVLSDFVFENLNIKAENNGFEENIIENVYVNAVNVEIQRPESQRNTFAYDVSKMGGEIL